MSNRDRDRPHANTQPKRRSTSNKRASNKTRRSVPATFVIQQRSREKAKACTARYHDHGCTTAKQVCGFRSPNPSPYDMMRNAVQTTINQAQIIDMENLMMLNVLNRNKIFKVEDLCQDSVFSGREGPSPKQNDNGREEENKGDNSGETSGQAAGMAGNEDDEEYQVEEEEAEMIISQSQGLAAQELSAAAYHAKKSITEQMRELQVSVMERAAKENEPADLMNYFSRKGYFDYNYDHEARSVSGSGANGTKKDSLYAIIGLSRKVKVHE